MEVSKINIFPYWQSVDNGERFVARMQEEFRQNIRELSTPISVETARVYDRKMQQWIKKWILIDTYVE